MASNKKAAATQLGGITVCVNPSALSIFGAAPAIKKAQPGQGQRGPGYAKQSNDMAKIGPNQDNEQSDDKRFEAQQRLKKAVEEYNARIKRIGDLVNKPLSGLFSKETIPAGPGQVMSIEELHELTGKHDDKQKAKTQADEDLPQTFAELFTNPDEDLPKLTALLKDFGLLNSDGKWMGSDTGKGRGKLMLVVDALNTRSAIQYHSDEITGKLICDHYGTRLGTRSYHNRPTDNDGLKDAVKGLFRPK